MLHKKIKDVYYIEEKNNIYVSFNRLAQVKDTSFIWIHKLFASGE